MDRREFITLTSAAALTSILPTSAQGQTQEPPLAHRLPDSDLDYERSKNYIEEVPVREYHWASDKAVENFRDMKFGLRVHWGLYSIPGQAHESWPFLKMSYADRQAYNEMYKTWNPQEFDADAWMNMCNDAGMKMLAFTTKHHEGFSMWDTKTRVRQRANWGVKNAPVIEPCDLAYSIMETPFKRDVVQEITTAARKHNLKIDLYFSHPDWYDADFRPYGWHPLQVPSSAQLWSFSRADEPPQPLMAGLKQWMREPIPIVPDPTPEEINRMVLRHRAQLTELLTHYGTIDMVCLDIFWGPKVWPQMRETILKMRELQPDVMLRARGIGNYGDYYTPEGFVPGAKESSDMPWFVIYPLGTSFSYEKDPAKLKGSPWIVNQLVDTVAKGGNFMLGIGPNGQGSFHPLAQQQLRETGEWLRVNGEGIYATRPRPGTLWSEGADLRFTRTKDARTHYCFALQWPGKTLTIRSMPSENIQKVSLLGYPRDLTFRRDDNKALVIDIPDSLQEESHRPCRNVWCFRLA